MTASRAVIDTQVIETLRNAAEALSLCCAMATTDAAVAHLGALAHDCIDAANALAARYVNGEPPTR